MKVIAIVNQKGGCGKTTTAVSLAAALGQGQERVLIIDMDPQGHASLGLGKPSADLPCLYEVLAGEQALTYVIQYQAAAGVDLVPGTITLPAAEHLLAGLPEPAQQLHQHLQAVRHDYDSAVIDCPPALGLPSINAIRAADRVLVPVEASLHALDGIERLRETLGLLEKEYGIRLAVTLLRNMFDTRTRLAREIFNELESHGALPLCETRIRNTVRVREAAYRGAPLTAFAPNTPVANDFQQLAAEVSGRPRRASATAERSRAQPARAPAKQGQARKGLREVVLSFRPGGEHRIQIAGDFNKWVPDAGVETKTDHGTLRKVLRRRPGVFEYRLVVGGVWQEDPANPQQVPNHPGGHNSPLQV